MRTLERNKSKLWYVSPLTEVDEIDENNYYTGFKLKTYNIPIEIDIALYPSNGMIVESIFGVSSTFDMLAVSNDVKLDKLGLLFLSEPVSNYDTTYDYKVTDIKVSLNTYNYGLESRR